jgi:hypothetical protein
LISAKKPEVLQVTLPKFITPQPVASERLFAERSA